MTFRSLVVISRPRCAGGWDDGGCSDGGPASRRGSSASEASAAATTPASRGRDSRAFDSIRATSRSSQAGTSSRSSLSRGGSSRRTFMSTESGSLPPNAARAGDALEEHAAEREHVGARVDLRLAAGLLRGHVLGRAADVAERRELLFIPGEARDAEVDEADALEVAALEDEVVRLHVAVHEPQLVDGGERLGDARCERGGLGERERAAIEPLREGLAVEPLHREVEPTAARRSVRDVTGDAGDRERREGEMLAREGAQRRRRGCLEELERDELAGPEVARAVHARRRARGGVLLDLEPVVDDLSCLHRADALLAGALPLLHSVPAARAVRPLSPRSGAARRACPLTAADHRAGAHVAEQALASARRTRRRTGAPRRLTYLSRCAPVSRGASPASAWPARRRSTT